MNKTIRLLELAKKRQSSCWNGYKNIGDYHNGNYECDFVSPYTKSASNVDTKVLIFLQDWASNDSLQGEFNKETAELGHTPNRPTNINLKFLLKKHFNLEIKDVYVTNLFPFIKPNSMNTRIPSRDMLQAAKEFGIPQIEIISPKIVIALGLSTFNALYSACENKTVGNIEEGINISPFYYQEIAIFCQAHTGRLGKNNRNKGGVDRVSNDWDKMSGFLE